MDGTSVPQRLKDLRETDQEDEGFVQVALHNKKVAALVAFALKRVKKVQPASKPREYVLPYAIPRRIDSDC